MRVCNVLKYMPQVVTDNGPAAPVEAAFATAERESVITPSRDATSAFPLGAGSNVLPEATDSARTVSCNVDGRPRVEIANRASAGTVPSTEPAAIWATEIDLLQAMSRPGQQTSAKTAQGRCNELETVDRLLSEGGGGGLGQQQVTSNSGVPPSLEITVRILLPDGSSEMVCAMLDTGARECNVISYERAMRWRAAKARDSFTGKPVTDT